MKGRKVFIVAPTRATCENSIALLRSAEFPTRLMREKGEEIINLVRRKKRFGIVAGTGSGKSASIKRIIREEFGTDDFKIDIVTREYEATERTWESDAIIITPGIALIWVKDGKIKSTDVVIFDEVHQTSEHLELSQMLALRVKCRIIWMSATVDPKVFKDYLESDKVIIFNEVEESKKAYVELVDPRDENDLMLRMIRRVIIEKRGMVVFLPTRRDTEAYAKETERISQGLIKVEFYHGGEPAAKVRPYLNMGVANNNRPFIVFMTNVGQSGLNIEGLNTTIIRDECVTEELCNGILVKTKACLPTNDLLQMGGRVDGRVTDGEIYIVTRRKINFHELRPEKVKFVLGHNLEELAMVCGKLGVDFSELKSPVPVDRREYAKIVEKFIKRGIFEPDGIRLTSYGRTIERIPTSVAWAEVIANCDREVLCAAAICASSSGLYKMLKKENDISEFIVEGSDHLTVYNIVAYAITHFSEIADDKGYTEYRFREKEFYAWAEEKGVNAKEIEEIALALKSILHDLGMPLVKKPPQAYERMIELFTQALVQTASLNVVFGEYDIEGNEVWAERSSVCEFGGTIIGTISAWKDSFGEIRRSIEGTEINGINRQYIRRRLKILCSVRQ